MPTDQHRGIGPGDLDAIGAAEAVRLGETSAAALLEDARARAARAEPDLGAVVTPLGRLGGGDGPLQGAVVAVKDLMAVRGVVRGCGAPEMVARGYLDAEPQASDAPAVASTSSAGGTLLATVATHPLAFGVITPQTRNPVVSDRIVGGSSGGSAAALAAGLVHLALGSDTGGSVRIPAASAGVVGLKTTRGRIPLTGVQPLSWTLDTVGPMAMTVADVARFLTVLEGVDTQDPVSLPVPVATSPPQVRRVGVPRQVDADPIDPVVRTVWRRTLEDLSDRGIEIVDVDLPAWPAAASAASLILSSEAAAVHRLALDEAPETIHPQVRERLDRAGDIASWRIAEAHHTGRHLRAQLRGLWDQVDVLTTPTLSCRVPEVGEEAVDVDGDDLWVVAALKHFVAPWNLAGVPAGSVPAGTDSNGAPIGVQFIGPHWGEALVLDAMSHVEQSSPVDPQGLTLGR